MIDSEVYFALAPYFKDELGLGKNYCLWTDYEYLAATALIGDGGSCFFGYILRQSQSTIAS